MIVVNYIAFILLAIGGLNWGLIGLFNYNLITAIFGEQRSMWTKIIYTLVFVATLWLIFAVIYNGGILFFRAM